MDGQTIAIGIAIFCFIAAILMFASRGADKDKIADLETALKSSRAAGSEAHKDLCKAKTEAKEFERRLSKNDERLNRIRAFVAARDVTYKKAPKWTFTKLTPQILEDILAGREVK